MHQYSLFSIPETFMQVNDKIDIKFMRHENSRTLLDAGLRVISSKITTII